MTSKLPVECPLCHRELDDEDLEDHLQRRHSKDELVQAIATLYEDDLESGPED